MEDVLLEAPFCTLGPSRVVAHYDIFDLEKCYKGQEKCKSKFLTMPDFPR